MAESDDGFLARWSRRKGGDRAAKDVRDDGGAPAPGDEPGPPAPADEAEIVARLPDIDSLDESSDFSAFLQDGVPEALRRRALRKLWRLNPVFANLDGLNDYDDDFTDAAMVIEGLKTVYQVGKGMLVEDEEAPEAAPDEMAEAPEDPAGAPAAAAETAESGTQAADSAEPPVPDPPSPEDSPRTEGAAARTAKRSARDRRWGGPTI